MDGVLISAPPLYTTLPAQNQVLASPNGAPGKPVFRAIVPADLGTGTKDSTTFLRGDGVWSNTLTGPLVISTSATASYDLNAITWAGQLTLSRNGGTGTVTLQSTAGSLILASSGVTALLLDSSQNVQVSSTSAYLGWSDAHLFRDAQTGILAQRDGTNPQGFRVYNTYTDASNYERGFVRWSSNVFELGTLSAGTGTNRGVRITAFGDQLYFNIGGGGGDKWIITNAGYFLAQGNEDLYVGTAALATSATHGFLGVNSCAGNPSGTPAGVPTGQVPMVVDSTNLRAYFYVGGAWHYAVLV